MTAQAARTLVGEGLWDNNPALVQLLGLCPLLAVTDTLVKGLALGVATTLVWVLSHITIASIRTLLADEIRIPAMVLVIAIYVTTVDLTMSAYFHDLRQALGIFIPLIVTNCAIIGRAEAFASRQPVPLAAVDALGMGLGFTMILVSLGAVRELIGQATLLSGAELIFGAGAHGLTLALADPGRGFLLAALPPGAFLGLGLLLALKNLIDAGRERRHQRLSGTDTVATPSGSH